MKFTWDEAKLKNNLAKHGLDFADAEIVFSGATFTFEDADLTTVSKGSLPLVCCMVRLLLLPIQKVMM